MVDGAAEDQPTQRAGPGLRRAWRRSADRRGVDCERLELAGAAGRARGIVSVVGRGRDLSPAEVAFGRAGAHGASYDLWRGHAARGCGTHRRVSRNALGKHLSEINFGFGISDRLRFGGSVYFLYVAVTKMSSSAGGDAHVCESSGGCVSWMAARC